MTDHETRSRANERAKEYILLMARTLESREVCEHTLGLLIAGAAYAAHVPLEEMIEKLRAIATEATKRVQPHLWTE